MIARGQDTPPPGIVATLGLTQRLEYSDNPEFSEDEDADFYGRTILNFGLDSIRLVDSFSLDLRTEIEEGRNDQSTTDFVNSVAALNYSRANRSSLIQTRLEYRETDVNGTDFEDDFNQDGDVINQDRGTRETYFFRLNGAVGRDAPIGATYEASYREIGYSGTNDPDFTDSSSLNLEGDLDFRLSPRVTAQLIALYRDFDAQGNGVSRETTGLGVGARLQLNPVLRARFALRWDSIKRSGDETNTDEGISLDSGLTRELQNGSVGLTFNTDVTTNDDGRRTFLGMNRNMVLPRAQELSYSFGVTRSDGTGVDPIFGVNYAYNLPRSEINFGLSQTVVTDRDNEEKINTSLRANFIQQINSQSSWNMGLAFFNRNELGNNPNDGQRLDFTVSYNYSLTRDWGLVSGYRYARSTEDDRDDRTSNTIFVGLQRDFDWRP